MSGYSRNFSNNGGGVSRGYKQRDLSHETKAGGAKDVVLDFKNN